MCQEKNNMIKDCYGSLISEGMYVNDTTLRRQGWIHKCKIEDGICKIKIKVVRKDGKILNEKSSYITDFEPSTNWCKALIDG